MSEKHEAPVYSLATVSKLNAATIFDGNTIDAVVSAVENEVRSIVPDISTAAGRKEIISRAAAVSKSKVVLEEMGKTLVADWKNKAKLVDADRKIMRDRLDALRDETRKPVTDWEEAAAKRIEALQERVATIGALATHEDEEGNAFPLSALHSRMEDLEAIVIDESFEEFKLDAMETKESATKALGKRIGDMEEQTRKDAELERLRLAEESRIQQERDATIAREAAETAAREEREKAQREKDEIERQRLAAIEEKEVAERQLIEQAEQAKKDAAQAAQKAEVDRQAAVDREIARQAEEKRITDAATAKREADIEHKRKINKRALECLVDAGVPEDSAKLAIEAIVKREVEGVTINY